MSLIVLEGLDGSGKSTQLPLLEEELKRRGPVRTVSFPDYSSPSSALVKMYLNGEFGNSPGDVNAYAAGAFYAVDRYASFKKDWQEDYRSGTTILAGRYTTSNMIYQMEKLPREEWGAFRLNGVRGRGPGRLWTIPRASASPSQPAVRTAYALALHVLGDSMRTEHPLAPNCHDGEQGRIFAAGPEDHLTSYVPPAPAQSGFFPCCTAENLWGTGCRTGHSSVVRSSYALLFVIAFVERKKAQIQAKAWICASLSCYSAFLLYQISRICQDFSQITSTELSTSIRKAAVEDYQKSGLTFGIVQCYSISATCSVTA